MDKFENLIHNDLHQLYLFGVAIQLKRMGYHMTRI